MFFIFTRYHNPLFFSGVTPLRSQPVLPFYSGDMLLIIPLFYICHEWPVTNTISPFLGDA
jgi:hypothetical protein